MSPASRQTLLKILLPALIIGVGYQLYSVPKVMKRVKAAEAALEKAKEQPPPFRALADQQRLLRALPKRRAELESRKTAIEAELAEALVCTDQARGREIEAVIRLFVSRGLRLIEEGPPKSKALPAALRSLKSRPQLKPGAEQRRLWKLDFEGRFVDALRAFEELGGVCEHAIPVSLELRKPGGCDDPVAAALSADPQRLWTVVIWI